MLGAEAVMWLAILYTFNKDKFVELKYGLKEKYGHLKNSAQSVWVKILESFEKDPHKIFKVIEEMDAIYNCSMSEETKQAINSILIPEGLKCASDPAVFKQIQNFIKKQYSHNVDIQTYMQTLQGIMQSYYNTRNLPSVTDLSSDQNNNEILYDERAVEFTLVSFYFEQFCYALIRVSTSSDKVESRLYPEIKEAFKTFMEQVIRSNKLSFGTAFEKNAYKVLERKRVAFVEKIDNYHQAEVGKKSVASFKENVYAAERVMLSVIVRLFDKNAIQFQGPIHLDGLSERELGSQGIRHVFIPDSWKFFQLDDANVVSERVVLTAISNNRIREQSASLDEKLMQLSRELIAPCATKKILTQKMLPELMRVSSITGKMLAEATELVGKLVHSMTLLNVVTEYFQQCKEVMGSSFYSSCNYSQWLELLRASNQQMIMQYDLLMKCDYLKQADASIESFKTKKVKGKLAVDFVVGGKKNQEVLTITNHESLWVERGLPLADTIEMIPAGFNFKGPLYRERIEVKQKLSNLISWHQEIEKEGENNIRKYNLEPNSQTEGLAPSEINMVIYLWKNSDFYSSLDKNKLKIKFVQMVGWLHELEYAINVFNQGRINFSTDEIEKVKLALGGVEQNCEKIFKTENGVVALSLKEIVSVDDLKKIPLIIREIKKIRESQPILDQLEGTCAKSTQICGVTNVPQPTRAVIESSSKEQTFRAVYIALYAAQRSLFKSRNKIEAGLSWAELQANANINLSSRSAVAMHIVNRLLLGRNWEEVKVEVFQTIHEAARKRSSFSFFRKSRCDHFNDSLSGENIKDFSQKSGSRTQVIADRFDAEMKGLGFTFT